MPVVTDFGWNWRDFRLDDGTWFRYRAWNYGDDAWLDDETHWIWQPAYDLSEQREKERKEKEDSEYNEDEFVDEEWIEELKTQ